MTESSSSLQPSNSGPLEITVLGGFRFWIKGKDALPGLPGGSQRLLALLAIREESLTRTEAAESLWPEASYAHAHGNLRSALSRLSAVEHEAVVASDHELRLAAQVTVDIREARALARRLLNLSQERERAGDLSDRAIAALSQELLPDWYDDWALIEAEDWRQLRMRALHTIIERLIASGHYADATGAALAVVKAEPLRETSHIALIRVHLAEGNRAEALAAFDRYRTLIRAELGVEPGPRIQALIKDLQSR